MKQTIEDVYSEKIEQANKNRSISKFVFEHEKFLYLVQWQKNKWSEPEKNEIL